MRNNIKGRDSNGILFYDPSKTMTFQDYFVANRESIFKGDVPKRYTTIASLVPGKRVLEIGSSDGTQSLVLAMEKEKVISLELMPEQFNVSVELQKSWNKLGKNVNNCTFINDSALDRMDLLNEVDTIFMSRLIYHLRENIYTIFDEIRKSSIMNIVLVGCPKREANWLEKGELGDAMGKYAYYASQIGMEKIVCDYGFKILRSIPSSLDQDPIVIASRD